MGKRLEKFREWFTPRRRLWIGIGVFALIVVVPMVRPGTNMIFLVTPAVMILLSTFGLGSNDKR
jgi:hypothetical protein